MFNVTVLICVSAILYKTHLLGAPCYYLHFSAHFHPQDLISLGDCAQRVHLHSPTCFHHCVHL